MTEREIQFAIEILGKKHPMAATQGTDDGEIEEITKEEDLAMDRALADAMARKKEEFRSK